MASDKETARTLGASEGDKGSPKTDISPPRKQPPRAFKRKEVVGGGEKEIRVGWNDVYLVEAVRQGGMGKVYIAKRKRDGQRHAVKTVLAEKLGTDAEREACFMRFRWESQVWMTLAKHRNIVQAHWFAEDELYRPVIVMEYVEGHPDYGVSLRDWLEWHRREDQELPLRNVLKIAIDVLMGLLHARKVMRENLGTEFVHRDLKPGNILITAEGDAKVTDFGLARAFSEVGDLVVEVMEGRLERVSFVSKGGVSGTPRYMAPEQWRGEEADERTDVYALGCTLYEMIAGRPPFAGVSLTDCKNAHLNIDPEPPGRDKERVPDGLRGLILRCLSKERESRPLLGELRDSLQEVHEALCDVKVSVTEEGEEPTARDWHDWACGFGRLGHHREVLKCCDRAIEIDPGFARAYNGRGAALCDLGQWDRAIKELDKAIELDPLHDSPHYNRGLAYYHLGELDRAIGDYGRAIELSPTNSSLYDNRGLAFAALRRFERAIEDYDKAIELSPGDARAHYNRGLSYLALGRLERAINDFDKAVELNTDYPVAYNSRGDVYRDLGRPGRAIEDYDKALRVNPALGHHERAIRDYNITIESDPTCELCCHRGNFYRVLDQPERAIEDLDKAIELNPSFGWAYYSRGEVYRTLGDPQRAIQDLSRFIELAPAECTEYLTRAQELIPQLKQELTE